MNTKRNRFWVRKMFKLQHVSSACDVILHRGKPVAICEKFFKIITKAHQELQHGGCDRTFDEVKRIYSWVPKWFISQFIKICPTCQVRNGSHLAPPNQSFPRNMMPQSIQLLSTPVLKESAFEDVALHRVQPDCLDNLNGHGEWVDTFQNLPSPTALRSHVSSIENWSDSILAQSGRNDHGASVYGVDTRFLTSTYVDRTPTWDDGVLAMPGRPTCRDTTLRNSQAGPKCERLNLSTGKPCNYVFSRSYELTRHEDSIHNAKQRVRCQLCAKETTFSRNDGLTRHIRQAHREVDWPGKRRRRGRD
ncbi:hypothetical protein N7478_000678 [Penicillium angulare]|uniref:uncharacterized protein n=1 Tax=Penicillium angulare TaxID=116970 RepID=UPI002540C210|nr:uncharacterized protein N7478_000678 [Penicillium angulare]KAJ5291427.1 hypothetical protein N7478_000678 [Penicillium angulare]